MTQSARVVGEFGLWVDHFEQNVSVHIHVDAAIDFDGQCQISDAVQSYSSPTNTRTCGFSATDCAPGSRRWRPTFSSDGPLFWRASTFLMTVSESVH